MRCKKEGCGRDVPEPTPRIRIRAVNGLGQVGVRCETLALCHDHCKDFARELSRGGPHPKPL